MLNLPPVHGYGVPQLLSQWQAGQDRQERKEQYQTALDFKKKDFALREEQFKQQQEQYKAQNEEKVFQRKVKIQNDAFKLLDTGKKLMGDSNTYGTGLALNKKAFEMINKVWPELDIDVAAISAAEDQMNELRKQVIAKLPVLAQAAESGDSKAVWDLKAALAGAYQLKVDEKVIELYKPKEKTPQSQQGKVQSDIKNGILTPEQAMKTPQPVPTDIDDYVERAKIAWKESNGTEMPANEQNKAALEFKRAQAPEVAANKLAVANVDIATKEKIAYNTTIGTKLAEIATAADYMEAKGEISPQAKKDNAKKRMSGNLAKLSNHYVMLNSTGAILNVENESFDNVLASLRSSTIGQALGNMIGTNEQSIRNSIKKIKPLLIQDIRQSTDMGARGLDSEKELEFYLQAATDEKTDIQSNIAAIVVLDEAFGEGIVARELRNLTDEGLIKRISEKGAVILNGKEDKKQSDPLGIR